MPHVFSDDSFLPEGTRQTDFYVKPNGDTVPATGYRYMDSQYTTQTMESYSAPGSYFGFDKYDSAAMARDKLQISTEWSDTMLRGEFDTLDIIDDLYVPTTKGNTTNILEPITKSYPEFGSGGVPQLKIDSDIWFNFRDVKVIGK